MFMRGLSCCWALAALVTIASGCRTTYREGGYSCTPTTYVTDCPPAWFCHSDLLCWSRAEEPDAAMPDAAMGDAGPHDAAARDGTIALPDGCALATYYRDSDGDHYGVASMSMQACAPPAGYASADGDCDDGDSAIHPGATEMCNAVDDDCSGAADDSGAVECVRGQPTTCMTTCGSVGTGTCSATCVRPTGVSCTPPTAETICDGLDDNCNGAADEGLGSVGDPVAAIPNGGTPTTQYVWPRIVSTSTGYMMFTVNAASPTRVFEQPLSPAGAPMGPPVPLDARISPGANVPVSVLRVAGGYLLAYGSWSFSTGSTGPTTLAFLDDLGAVHSYGTLAPPTGYGAWPLVVLVAGSVASRVSVYANLRTTDSSPTFALRRYSVDYAGATPIVISETNIATDLSDRLFDVAMGASPDEWVIYGTSSNDVQLVRFDSVVRPIGTITNAPSLVGVGLELASGAPVSSTNPLGIIWVDYVTTPTVAATMHFLEASSTVPLSLGAPLALPSVVLGSAGNVVQIVAVPNGSVATRSGHWFVASSLHVWDVLGNGGAPTATSWTPPDTFNGESTLAIYGGGRISYTTSAFDAVTRRVGCR
jgi:hypothetical protein